jgi:hypothetical protein
MNQRGVIATGWLYLAGAIALLLAIAFAVKAWDGFITGVEKRGYDRGVSETTASFEKRDNAQLVKVIVEKDRAVARAAEIEGAKRKADLAAVARYKQGVEDGKLETERNIAAVRDGSLGLRDPGARAGAARDCQAGAGKAPGPAARSDGAAGGEFLSAAAGVFLLEEASRADEVVKQLTAAQAIILSDRTLCNAP